MMMGQKTGMAVSQQQQKYNTEKVAAAWPSALKQSNSSKNGDPINRPHSVALYRMPEADRCVHRENKRTAIIPRETRIALSEMLIAASMISASHHTSNINARPKVQKAFMSAGKAPFSTSQELAFGKKVLWRISSLRDFACITVRASPHQNRKKEHKIGLPN